MKDAIPIAGIPPGIPALQIRTREEWDKATRKRMLERYVMSTGNPSDGYRAA
jgi:hypothetical protein